MLTTTMIRINERLYATDCAASHLAAINEKVSQSALSRALAGQKQLDSAIEMSLLQTLDEMIELMKSSIITPDWSKHDQIRDALRIQREFKEAIAKDQIPTLDVAHEPGQ